MSETNLVYVCHPFSDDPEGNMEKVRRICREICDTGHIPIAPQIYLPQFMSDEAERERAMEACFQLLA